MGAQPKRKISKGRRNRRRAQDALQSPSLSSCPKCNRTRRPHFVCSYCGYYGEKPKPATKKPTTKKPVETKATAKKTTVKKATSKKGKKEEK